MDHIQGVQPGHNQPELFTKSDIRQQYQDCNIGYDYAIALLRKLGFTKFAADQYLFGEV